MANAFVGTAELLQLGDGNISDIEVSQLLQDAPLLAAMAAIEASNDTSHEWLKKTAAPNTGFRALNDGRENSKATYTKVTQALKLYDASFSLDLGLLKSRNGDALRRREAMDHLKAAFADMEKQIIYGTGNDADGFAGFANETSVDKKDDAMVVDATGTTVGGATSVWAIRMDESAVAAVFGANGQIEIGEEFQAVLPGSATGVYDAMRTPILFWGGVQVATSLDLGRIVNLTAQAGKGLTDALISQLLAKFPAARKPNLLVMSTQSQSQLQQSRTATTVTGAPAPIPNRELQHPDHRDGPNREHRSSGGSDRMNLMQRGLKVHAAALIATAGETISYSRDGSFRIFIKAVVGQTVIEDVTSDGETRIETKTVDFLITPAEFKKAIFSPSARDLEPQRGDRIRRQDEAAFPYYEEFDVVPGASGKVWEWSDGHRTHYRIHSVRRTVPNVPS